MKATPTGPTAILRNLPLRQATLLPRYRHCAQLSATASRLRASYGLRYRMWSDPMGLGIWVERTK